MSGFSTTGRDGRRRRDRDVAARWRCGASSPPGSAAWGSSCCSSPSSRACASAAARRCSRPSRRARSSRWRRRSASRRKRFVAALRRASPLVEVAILSGLGFAGIDERMTFYNAVATRLLDGRHRRLLARAALARAASRPPTQWVLVVFMLVAGTNFALLYVGHRRPPARRRSAATRSSGSGSALFAAASLVVVVALISEGVLEGEEAIRARRVQHGVDDDHHRVRQRRLRPLDGADVDRAGGRHADRRLGGVDERLDQAHPPHRDRARCCGARSTRRCTRGRRGRCGCRARSSTSAPCAR